MLLRALAIAALIPCFCYADSVFTDAHIILNVEDFDSTFREDGFGVEDFMNDAGIPIDDHYVFAYRVAEPSPSLELGLHATAIFSVGLQDENTATLEVPFSQETFLNDRLWIAQQGDHVDRNWLMNNDRKEWANPLSPPTLQVPVDGSAYLATTYNNFFNDLNFPFHQQWGWAEIGVSVTNGTVVPYVRSSSLARDVRHTVIGEMPKEMPRVHTGRIGLTTPDEVGYLSINPALGLNYLVADAVDSQAGNPGRDIVLFDVTKSGEFGAILSPSNTVFSSSENWYLIEEESFFGPEYVAAHDRWDTDITVTLNEPFFVGVNFDETSFDAESAKDYFGWAQLNIDDNLNITMISSAAINDGGSIFVSDTQPLPDGDITEDGIVNAADLNVIGLNWQQSVDGFEYGDVTGDGFVDVADLNVIGLNWQSPAFAPVPEPTAPWFVLVVAGMLDRRRTWSGQGDSCPKLSQ